MLQFVAISHRITEIVQLKLNKYKGASFYWFSFFYT